MSWEKTYQEWLDNEQLSESLRQELVLLARDTAQLKDAFYAPLTFGTAGMRGILGPGINRMNSYTVRQATEGFALFIEHLAGDAKKRGVVIAYDSRHQSPEFALDAARVLANHGIKVYLFTSLRPTPELSFAVRELGCIGGIMITASHNPAEYNGYKVYGEDGGQMPPQEADKLTAYVQSITDSLAIDLAPHSDLVPSPYIEWIDEVIDQRYLEKLKEITLDQTLIDQYGKDLKLVYTALHGTGAMIVEKSLKQAGFDSFILEPTQAIPDPDFTTVVSPNPEEYSAFEYAIKLGEQQSADLLVATDPDADRLGAAVRLPNGDYQVLTGNQIAALLINYILMKKAEKDELIGNETMVKSIVSSEFGTAICEKYHVKMENVLTGFKFIAEKIKTYEQTNEHTFLFGYEESYGYLVQPFVRDKDAIQAMLLLAEVAAYYKSQGLTLYDGLLVMFEEFGYFEEKTISVTMSGIEGAQAIKDLMSRLREEPLTEFADVAVVSTEDYGSQIRTYQTGEQEPIDLPKADVVKYALADGSWLAVRPSGTEPKIKFYIAVRGESVQDSQAKIESFAAAIQMMIK